jgi:hypothetical protein
MQVLPKAMADSSTHSISRPKHHNQWLILIAAFKLAQALLFVAIGVGVVRLLHKDVADVLTKAAEHLRFRVTPRQLHPEKRAAGQ